MKRQISPLLLTLLIFFGANQLAFAQKWNYQMRGHLFARLNSYTEKAPSNYGQQARLQFEQSLNIGKNFSAINQLRTISNSLNSDLSPNIHYAKKETFETYLGENYLKYKSDNWVALLGYQEVIWGEAFGINYADIIGPKDQRETLYSDASDARLPLLLLNTKSFFSVGKFSGSLQLLYSPEPRYSKTLPLDILAGKQFSNTNLIANKEKTPELFKKNEYGGRFAGSYAGIDFSAFTFSYIDRDPHYTLNTASLTSITLNEAHTKISSSGLSFAKSIFDYVFRTDIVLTNEKAINYLENSQIKNFSTKMINAALSIDSPSYNDYSGVFIFAQSSLGDIKANSFRDQKEQYLIGKLSKNLGSDRTFELSYTHELMHPGHSFQSFINWPINSTTDLKFGGQVYYGDDSANLSKYKNISSVFFSIKNYFQL